MTNVSPAEIPPLRPALPEVPPGFWEQYGVILGVAGLLLILVLGVLVWLLTRKKPVAPEAPAIAARQQLSQLSQDPANARLLSKVSHVVKQYLANAFELPKEEMTTGEFCRALTGKERLGPELSSRAVALLRSWDEQKFSPTPPPPAEKPVEQANQMVDLGESRLAELRRAEQEALARQSSAPVPKTT